MAKRNISGIFLLDKPEGITSSTALVRTRGIFKAQKGGHTGSLDPFASGLLPVCLGEAAKFSSFFLEGNKRYEAEATLGRTTTTCDRDGETVLERPIGDAMERLESVLEQFRGKITQVPPIYSAVKVNGKRLYKYARQGREDEEEIPKREVEILELKLLEKGENTFKVEVYCSKGTYIRSLISDIGEALGCGAYVSQLRRTFVEGLPQGTMHTLKELQDIADSREDRSDFSQLDAMLLPLESALSNLPVLELPVKLADPLSHGMRLGPDFSGAKMPEPMVKPNELVQVHCHDVFLGVCYFDEHNKLIPQRMMGPEHMAALLERLKNEHKA